jgi:hypothetical protein
MMDLSGLSSDDDDDDDELSPKEMRALKEMLGITPNTSESFSISKSKILHKVYIYISFT